MDSAAFLVISLADSAILGPLGPPLPSHLVESIQISCLLYAETCHSTQILHQTKFSIFSSCFLCQELRLVIQPSDTASALSSQPRVEPTNIVKCTCGCAEEIWAICAMSTESGSDPVRPGSILEAVGFEPVYKVPKNQS